jgi:hypothetical protein
MILVTGYFKCGRAFRNSYVHLTCLRYSRLRLPAVLLLACGISVINECAQSAFGTPSSSSPAAIQIGTGDNNGETTTGSVQKDWKTVTVPIADLTMTLPTESSEESPSSEPQKNGDVTWTHYSYEWRTAEEKRDWRLDVYVFVTNWDKDFPPEAGGGSTDNMLERSYKTTEPSKTSGEIDELRYLELDGVKGLLVRGAQPQDKNRISVNWVTYRYHRKKAQKLTIAIRGARGDLERLMKVIGSVRLAQK